MLDYSGNLDKTNELALYDDFGIKFSSIWFEHEENN